MDFATNTQTTTAPADPKPTPLETARQAAGQLEQALDLKGRVDRHPYGMVLAALGAGYVLGGGLFTPTTGRVLRLALKLASIPVVQHRLLDLAEAAVEGLAQREGAPAPPVAGPDKPSPS